MTSQNGDIESFLEVGSLYVFLAEIGAVAIVANVELYKVW
jgi:hypothetical protein